jgi:flagellar biosynthetic protein FlhB
MSEGEEDQDSKTEEPSQKKLDDARDKGQVVNSKEVTSFLLFLLLTISVIWIAPYSMQELMKPLKFFVENSGTINVNQGTIDILLPSIMKKALMHLAPLFFIVMVATIFSSYVQHGEFIFTLEPLSMDISKLSIFKGLKRIFSLKSFVEFLKGLFKIILVGCFVSLAIYDDIQELGQYHELSIAGIIAQLGAMLFHILALVTLIMGAIAIIDYSYQTYEHHKSLKMTKQEVKDEYKQAEGNPEIKQKLRQLRRKRIRRALKQVIPEATVIITNPEHYAVALKYDKNQMNAPICIYKGLDLVAQKIKALAKDHDIPIVESPPLARGLYKDVQIDEEISVEYFDEVAKIISYVMSLDKKKKR